MPKYRRGKKGRLQRTTKNFEHPYQMIHFLNTATPEQYKPFRDLAKTYLDGSNVPGRKLRVSALEQIAYGEPRKLVPHLVNEFEDGGEQLGGGIASGLSTLVHEGAHLLGLDLLWDKIFGAPKKKLQSLEGQKVAYLVDQTYKPSSKRKDKTIGFTRLPQFDSDMISVWQDDKTGELTVTVRGTKFKPSDLLADTQILLGKTNMVLPALEETLNEVEKEFPGEKYNIGGHSLGNAYIFNELDHKANWDGVYIFSPPASPLQSDSTVSNWANQEGFNYYVNQGDLVSGDFSYFFEKDTLADQVYYGDYRYDPVSSHSLTQYYPPFIADSDDLPPAGPTYDREDAPEQLPTDEAVLGRDTEETRVEGLS